MSALGADLELALPTPAAWASAVLERPLELLSDHAHCELRAAAVGQSLILRRTTDAEYAARLGAHAAEELAHFRRVLRVLHARGGALLPAQPNPYMEGLDRRAAVTRSSGLLDRLLIAALIERRSLERFELLRDAADGELATLYAELGPSERGHALAFVELARRVAPAAEVDARLAELVPLEAQAMDAAPFAPRMHSGPPAEVASGPGRPRSTSGS